jgi:hypothetical protein
MRAGDIVDTEGVETWIRYTCMEISSKENVQQDVLESEEASNRDKLGAVVAKIDQLWDVGQVSRVRSHHTMAIFNVDQTRP